MRKLRVLFLTFFIATTPALVHAATIIPPGCTDSRASTPCGLVEFGQLFANIYDTAVGYVGAVALLFFVLGGVIWLMSGGRSEWIDWGRRILTSAVLGTVIILLSFMIVRYLELNILQADTAYIVGSDEQCAGKQDGTRCARDGGNPIYTCIEGICSTKNVCQFKYPNGEKNCTLRTYCVSGTEEEGQCWGSDDENWVCCELKDFDPIPTGNNPVPILP